MENKPVKTCATVKDVDAQEFNRALSQYLKRTGKLVLPLWVDLVKTGHGKELCPSDPDWFYVRAASVARKIYLNGDASTTRLKRIYSSRKNRNSRPHHSTTGSGAVARRIMQALENIKILEKSKNGGRRISSVGRKDLDRIATQVYQEHMQLDSSDRNSD